MTDFNTYELSTQDSAPIQLYKFECFDVDGTTVTRSWYYTNYSSDITYSGNVYKATEVKNTNINLSDNADDSQITVEIISSAQIVKDNIISYADENIKVTVYRQQNLTYTNTIFTGYVIQFSINSLTTQIACDSGLSTSRRPVLFYIYSAQCMVHLYSEQCGVSLEAYKITATCVGVSGKTIYFNGENTDNSGFYKAGLIKTTTGESRTIQSHHGNRIEVTRPFRDLESGDTIYLYRGCDHSVKSCTDNFNNIVNYKGCPFMPDRSPFVGNGVEAI